jgi:hypothetical protein
VKLGRIGDLLSQVGRGIDQEPVGIVGRHRDRGLTAPQVWPLIARRTTNPASAIPLRNTAAGRGSKNDNTQHEIALNPGQFASRKKTRGARQ